jgi:hypothetical protein
MSPLKFLEVRVRSAFVMPASEEYRDKLIERAKKYVKDQRMQPEVLFAGKKVVMAAALRGYQR